MRCTCDLARREAREETLREVIRRLDAKANHLDRYGAVGAAHSMRVEAAGIAALIKPPCGFGFAEIGAPSVAYREIEPDARDVDCVEVDAPSPWPALDGGLDG